MNSIIAMICAILMAPFPVVSIHKESKDISSFHQKKEIKKENKKLFRLETTNNKSYSSIQEEYKIIIPLKLIHILKNYYVEILTREGKIFRGKLIIFDDINITLLNSLNKTILININEILEIKQLVEPKPLTLSKEDAPRVELLKRQFGSEYLKPNGEKMHNIGSALLALSITEHVIGTGLAVAAYRTEDTVFSITSASLIIGGIVTAAIGIPIMVKGKTRRLNYYKWLYERSLTGKFLPMQKGGGIVLKIVF